MRSNPIVKQFDGALHRREFDRLVKLLPLDALDTLFDNGFDFYRATFWIDSTSAPSCELDLVLSTLFPLADAGDVAGVEWWISIRDPNQATPWLLDLHFDRDGIDPQWPDNPAPSIESRTEADFKCPVRSSVLFLRTLPIGDLIVTDQRAQTRPGGPDPLATFERVEPVENRYAVFPGDALHGVQGGWTGPTTLPLRLTLALNFWATPPAGAPISRSSTYRSVLGLS